MFEFAPDLRPLAGQSSAEFHDELIASALAMVAGEPDRVANMANLAALLWQALPDLNWAGFYRVLGKELVLGPFIGKPACIRIPRGRGVCGTAWASARTQLVPDVHAFPGHIACDSASRSELVVPVFRDRRVFAVIDLDSPLPARFDTTDQAGIEAFASAIAPHI